METNLDTKVDLEARIQNDGKLPGQSTTIDGVSEGASEDRTIDPAVEKSLKRKLDTR